MIKSFTYRTLGESPGDGELWRLDPVEFGALSLLVGPSGVGKTRILRALLEVREAALQGLSGVSSGGWELQLEIDGRILFWEAVAGSDLGSNLPRTRQYLLEKLTIDGALLIERDEDRFLYKGNPLPQLDRSQSCIQLLSSEPDLAPFLAALRPWRFHAGAPGDSQESLIPFSAAELALKRIGSNLSALGADAELAPFLKLFLVQRYHPALFRSIARDFQEIFPTIEEIKVGRVDELDVAQSQGKSFERNKIAVGAREAGVPTWILHPDLSAGMAKTLELLIETRLSPPGGVFLIDELENSLGVNCMPQVAGLLLEGLDRRQIIATSHHFRVINEIPFSSLKVVERIGTRVTVRDAMEIPEVKNAGSLDRFTELLNYLERQQELE